MTIDTTIDWTPRNIKTTWCAWRFRAIGEALVNPIRQPLDYEGLARKIFRVEPLPSKPKDDSDGT